MPLLRSPLSVTLEITSRCNLNCKYCFAYGTEHQNIPTEMVIDIIDSLLDAGIYRIEISGGEPFLHPGIFKILEHVQRRDIPKWSVSSNGVLFKDKHFIKILRSIVEPEEFVHHFQISIDSHMPEYNDITRGHTIDVMNGIHNLINTGFKITLATVVHKFNISVADQVIDHYYPIGVKHYHYMNLLPCGNTARREQLRDMVPNNDELLLFWSKLQEKVQRFNTYIHVDTPLNEIAPTIKNGRILKESIESNRCTAAFTHLTILSNYNVVPCSMARHVIMGNLKNESISSIWNSTKSNNIRASVINPCEIVS